MTETETLLHVGMAAALADGSCTDDEREQLDAVLRRVSDAPVAWRGTPELPVDLPARLPTPEVRRATYELAVAVCNADGRANAAEQGFLRRLRSALGLSESDVAAVERDAGALASVPVPAEDWPGIEAPTSDVIRQHAILAGALELLPQSLAAMAVIPVQLRLVYLIGQRHGYRLDVAQAKDLVATLGLGAAAQVVDGVMRKILSGVARGVLGRVLGGVTGGAAGMAAGAATAFASTYALGHAAEQYYVQGRALSAADLRGLVAKLRDEAQALYPTLREQIEVRARTLDLPQLMSSLARGDVLR